MGLKFQKTMLLRSKLLRVERDLRGCDLRVVQVYSRSGRGAERGE